MASFKLSMNAFIIGLQRIHVGYVCIEFLVNRYEKKKWHRCKEVIFLSTMHFSAIIKFNGFLIILCILSSVGRHAIR